MKNSGKFSLTQGDTLLYSCNLRLNKFLIEKQLNTQIQSTSEIKGYEVVAHTVILHASSTLRSQFAASGATGALYQTIMQTPPLSVTNKQLFDFICFYKFKLTDQLYHWKLIPVSTGIFLFSPNGY